MRRWAATGLVLVAACGTGRTDAAQRATAPPAPAREIPVRELWEDESFGEFRVTSYNLHPVAPRRVEVLGGGHYVAEEPAQPECYVSYGGPAAFIEPDYLMNDLTKGDGFSILGTATFSEPPPPHEALDVVCRPTGWTRS